MSAATPGRKLDHVRINLEEDVGSRLTTGLERYRLAHRALPELDLDEVSTVTSVLGHAVDAPLLISSMTGGADGLEDINRRLATAAQERRIAMGVGSQRAALEDRALARSFEVRRYAPKALLFANLGAAQLSDGYGTAACLRAVDMIEAQALIVHLNPLQEAVQPEGDTQWRGLLARIEKLATRLPVPLIAKEVGWGIGPQEARRLSDAGVAAVDVAGAGGTSWSEVESHRATTAADRAVAEAFIGWGIPTAESLIAVREAAPNVAVFASGGLRDGIDVAKSLALGATIAGLAGPFLRAATESTEAVVEAIDILSRTLRVAMFASGHASIDALRGTSALHRVDGRAP